MAIRSIGVASRGVRIGLVVAGIVGIVITGYGTVKDAVDVIKLNSFGMRSSMVDAEVSSPCAGAIISAGNRVTVRCGDVNVHLEPVARAGAIVAKGEQLHIYAERNGVAVPMKLGGEWWVRNELARR